jgi:DNA-binding response OmpR family regulator
MTLSPILVGVVEDDSRVLESLEELLASGGYRVLLFSSAESFIEANGFQKVDCLISDVGLPGMSGCDLLQIARADHPNLPVILITARDEEPASRLLAGWSGARRIFRKPFDGAMLVATVQDLVRPAKGR